MEEQNENSSTTILLVISVAVLAIVAGGWFFLDGGSDPQPNAPATRPVAAETPAETAGEAPGAEPAAEMETEVETAADETDSGGNLRADVDANLRKARLAAEADVLLDPPQQSALFFYGQVLDLDPANEVASAELNALLGRLNATTTSLLAGEDWDEAYRIALRVAEVRADHALVNDVQQSLDQHSGSLVTQAMQTAENGDSDAALQLIAQAEALPGRNPQYFSAVRETIQDLLTARQAAEVQEAESAQEAAALATSTWMERVRTAIGAGQLIGSDGDTALAYFNERADTDEISNQLRQELVSAMIAAASSDIAGGNLADVEQMIAAGRTLQPDSEELTALSESLEQELLTRESEKVYSVADLDRITMVPARYPRRAEERGVSGWVTVLFTVTEAGDTTDITVVDADPKGVFDSSAIRAVEQWKFTPGQFRGQTIAQRATTRLVFQLN